MIRIPVLGTEPQGIPVHANCARCTALCCNYVSTEIDVPTTKHDFDILRWYLMHPGVRVYCEDSTGGWFIQFLSRCRFLGRDNLCTIYETRPQICRDLDPELCEFAQGPGDRHLFTTLEELDRWLLEKRRRDAHRKAAGRRRPRRRRRDLSAARA